LERKIPWWESVRPERKGGIVSLEAEEFGRDPVNLEGKGKKKEGTGCYLLREEKNSGGSTPKRKGLPILRIDR